MIILAEETITRSHAPGRPGRVACAFDPPCDASAAGPIPLAWLCGWPLRRAPARRFIKRGRILLLFTDEVSLIRFEAEAASLFFQRVPGDTNGLRPSDRKRSVTTSPPPG